MEPTFQNHHFSGTFPDPNMQGLLRSSSNHSLRIQGPAALNARFRVQFGLQFVSSQEVRMDP